MGIDALDLRISQHRPPFPTGHAAGFRACSRCTVSSVSRWPGAPAGELRVGDAPVRGTWRATMSLLSIGAHAEVLADRAQLISCVQSKLFTIAAAAGPSEVGTSKRTQAIHPFTTSATPPFLARVGFGCATHERRADGGRRAAGDGDDQPTRCPWCSEGAVGS